MAISNIDIRKSLLKKFQDFCKVDGEILEYGELAFFDPSDTTNHPFMVSYDGSGIEFVQLVYPDNNKGTPRDYDIIYKCKDLAELKAVYNVVSKAKIFKW